eukprot:Platyproteum_vivax@DN17481_c0_g1_i1.p1
MPDGHSETMKRKCPKCNYTATQKLDLITHMKKHNPRKINSGKLENYTKGAKTEKEKKSASNQKEKIKPVTPRDDKPVSFNIPEGHSETMGVSREKRFECAFCGELFNYEKEREHHY